MRPDNLKIKVSVARLIKEAENKKKKNIRR
jgi:hypothetical protein